MMFYCYVALNKLDLSVAAVRDAESRFSIHSRIHLQYRCWITKALENNMGEINVRVNEMARSNFSVYLLI